MGPSYDTNELVYFSAIPTTALFVWFPTFSISTLTGNRMIIVIRVTIFLRNSCV